MSFPFRGGVFEGMSKRIWSRRKLLIDEVWVAELLDSISIAFERSDDIDGCVVGGIFVGKVEFFCDFFHFSDIGRSIVNVAWNLYWLLCWNFRLFMRSWLLDCFLFRDYFRDGLVFGLFGLFIFDIYFTNEAKTFSWVNVVSARSGCGFFILDSGFDFCSWLNISFGLDFFVFGFDHFGSIDGCIKGLFFVSACGLRGRWLIIRFGWLLFFSLGLLFGGSSGNGLHSSAEEKVVHIFFKVGSLSIGIKGLFFVFNGLIVIFDS